MCIRDRLPAVAADFAAGPSSVTSYMGKVASFLYERFLAGEKPDVYKRQGVYDIDLVIRVVCIPFFQCICGKASCTQLNFVSAVCQIGKRSQRLIAGSLNVFVEAGFIRVFYQAGRFSISLPFQIYELR